MGVGQFTKLPHNSPSFLRRPHYITPPSFIGPYNHVHPPSSLWVSPKISMFSPLQQKEGSSLFSCSSTQRGSYFFQGMCAPRFFLPLESLLLYIYAALFVDRRSLCLDKAFEPRLDKPPS